MFRCLVLTACLAVALAGVTHKNDWEGWEKPAFCRTNDCPVYDLVETAEGYEKRSYKAGQWVSTEIEGIDFIEPNPMFQRLFRYISGANDRGKIALLLNCLDKHQIQQKGGLNLSKWISIAILYVNHL